MNVTIEVGENTNGELVSIHETMSGKTDLVCPFCGQPLIAKKGTKVAHHFAHETDSCIASAGSIFGQNHKKVHGSLSEFAFFHIREQRALRLPPTPLVSDLLGGELSPDDLQNMLREGMKFLADISKGTRENQQINAEIQAQFEVYEGFSTNDFELSIGKYRSRFIFTADFLAKIPQFWRLSSSKIASWIKVPFDVFAKTLKAFRIDMWQDLAKWKRESPMSNMLILPKELYSAFVIKSCAKYDASIQATFAKEQEKRNQMQAIHDKFSLYLLHIRKGIKTFYKVGITSRPMPTRIQEITKQIGGVDDVEVLFYEPKMAFMESYIKHHYSMYKYAPFEGATEYFAPPFLYDEKAYIQDIVGDLNEIKDMVVDFKMWERWRVAQELGKVIKYHGKDVCVMKYEQTDGYVYVADVLRMHDKAFRVKCMPLTEVKRATLSANGVALKEFANEKYVLETVTLPSIEKIAESKNIDNLELIKQLNLQIGVLLHNPQTL